MATPTYDPTSHFYRDAQGRLVNEKGELVTYFGPARQATRNVEVSNDYLGRLAAYNQQYEQAFGGQNALAAHLADVRAGRAPSVAGQQLQIGLGNIQNQALSQAAGVGGPNAVVARLAAIHAATQAGLQTNQAAALARAQEVADAARTEAGVRAAQAGEAGNMFQTSTAGAKGFSDTAAADAQTQEQRNAADSAANKQLVGNLTNAGGAALASAAGAPKSDKREKKNVKKADMGAFLDKLAGFQFDYKHPGSEGEAPGHRIGIMAQDAEKSAVGKSMVLDGDRLSLDIPNAVGAALAAVAYLHQQMKARGARKAA